VARMGRQGRGRWVRMWRLGEGRVEPTNPAPKRTIPFYQTDFSHFKVDVFEEIARAKLEGRESSFTGHELYGAVEVLVDRHIKELSLEGGRLKYGSAFYIPVGKREETLFYAHDAPTAGHMGRDATLARLKPVAWWPGMSDDVAHYVRICGHCQRSKDRPGIEAPQGMWPVNGCFERAHMDLMGPLVETERGNKYVLTLVDSASKYVVGVPTADKTATTIARAFVENVVLRYGVPALVVTDNAPEFIGELNSALRAQLGIASATSAPFHPQGNGQIERQHGTLAQCFVRWFIQIRVTGICSCRMLRLL